MAVVLTRHHDRTLSWEVTGNISAADRETLAHAIRSFGWLMNLPGIYSAIDLANGIEIVYSTENPQTCAAVELLRSLS